MDGAYRSGAMTEESAPGLTSAATIVYVVATVRTRVKWGVCAGFVEDFFGGGGVCGRLLKIQNHLWLVLKKSLVRSRS
jgi:hypothetical protein